ncbi:MAG: S8 family serine peptidase [Nitrospirota bacterium]
MKLKQTSGLIFLIGILWIITGCGDSTTPDIKSESNIAISSVNSQKKDVIAEDSFKKRTKIAYVPGEILVKFKSYARTSAADIERKGSETGVKTKLKRSISPLNIHHLKITEPDMAVEDAIERLKSHPDVEFAEPNYIVRAFATTPTDPSFSSLWGLDNTGQTGGTVDADIDAPDAWDVTTGSSSVIIAIVDTGVAYTHPDLAGNIWINTGETAGDGVDDDGNGYADDIYGWDFIDNDGYPEDYYSHGTHVAGTIAAVGDNSTGITGVMWQAKIMPLRFLGVSGAGDTANAVSAIIYAADNGAKIINASWGEYAYSQSLYDAIAYARQMNVLFVAAAGNETNNNDIYPLYPASYNLDNIISVAATDDDDRLASFSNYGSTSVDIGSPGVSIYSSIPTFTYDTAVSVYNSNFDTDTAGSLPTGWSSGGTSSTWAVTDTTANSVPNSLTDSPSGNYVSNTDSWAGYMTPITSEKNNLYTLSFQWKGYIDPTTYDYLDINYSTDGITWDWIDWTDGNYSTWTNFTTTEITAAADLLGSFYFGFGLESDIFGNYDGAYIDDVSFVRQPIIIDTYTYDSYDGTSMASPHVSGVAGLVLSANSSLSYQEVKDVILNNVDQKIFLSGKTYTGGRLNAYNAVYAAVNYSSLPTTPSGLTAAAISSYQINLSWTNSANETGFKIERKLGANGIYTEIATTGADVTTYSDTIGLSASTTYYYKIRAYNSYGKSSYSNEASATTQAVSYGDGGDDGDDDGGGGGCFIATAAYGSYLAPEVKTLQQFRDNYLVTNSIGRAFVGFYYKASPPIARYISRHEALRLLTRLALTPFVYGIKYPFVILTIVSLVITMQMLYKRLSV